MVRENKKLIVGHLFHALKATRAFEELIDLDYIEPEEIVVAHFERGGKRTINVACDSGIAMIRDIVSKIGG